MRAMDGEEFLEWIKNNITSDHIFLVEVEDEESVSDEVPYEWFDMANEVHFRYCCPHGNMHGTCDIELSCDGHVVVVKGFHNGEFMPDENGDWPMTLRCESDAEAIRVYLCLRRQLIDFDFEIVDT
jgi:hypothetical protein